MYTFLCASKSNSWISLLRCLAWHYQIFVLAMCSQPRKKFKYQLFLETENNYGLPTVISTTQGSLLDGNLSKKGFVPQMNFQHQTCNASSWSLLSPTLTSLIIFYSLKYKKKKKKIFSLQHSRMENGRSLKNWVTDTSVPCGQVLLWRLCHYNLYITEIL